MYNINNKNKKVILFATTDLTHYGKRFNNISLLNFPQELNKWRREEKLINNLLKNNLENEDLETAASFFAEEAKFNPPAYGGKDLNKKGILEKDEIDICEIIEMGKLEIIKWIYEICKKTKWSLNIIR